MLSNNLAAADRISPIFAALGDVTRLELVRRLGHGEPRSIMQLADGLGISHQGVTKHLKVLENAGLIAADKVGRERRYKCSPTQLHAAQRYLDDVARQWDSALVRLQSLVED